MEGGPARTAITIILTKKKTKKKFCTMDEFAAWHGMGKTGAPRRKRSLSAHQKQMRFLTIVITALVLAVFTAVIYWCNL
jgi:hypothetical protein